MKVLHIFDHSVPYFSGYTFRSGYILANQKKQGFEPIVLTSLKHEKQKELRERIDDQVFYRTAPLNGPLSRLLLRFPVAREYLQMRRLFKRILEVHAETGGDLLHAHSPLLNGYPALRAARRLKIPMVYEIRAFWEDAGMDLGTYTSTRSFKYRSVRASETRLCEKVDGITTICEGLRNDLVGRGIDQDKITIIPNCVETARFQPLERDRDLMELLNLEPGKVIGFIGSFYDYEGLEVLLEAFALALRKRDDLRLLLVGGGYQGQEEALKKQARDLGLDKRCTFTGRVPHAEVRRFYSIIDFFVYPRRSLRVTELVTPLKPLEAMSMEKIVLGSSVGGIAELVRDKETGFLFEPDNPEAAAAVLLEAMADPARLDIMRRDARRYVEEERNWEKAVGLYRSVYERAGRVSP